MAVSKTSKLGRIILASGATLALTAGTTPHAAAVASHPGAVVSGPPMTIIADTEGAYARNFNPFISGSISNSQDFVYEPLLYYDVPAGKTIPWLASSYHWLAGNKKVVINLRHNIKWSNGSVFTSADVTFTFAMLKKYPAMDLQGQWQYLKSVTAKGPYAVEFTFDKPEIPFLYFVAGQTPIVSKSIWAHVKNPSTWADPNPVGTGPYLLKSFSSELVTYTRNPHYWGKAPTVPTLLLPAYTSNTSADLALASGQGDWAAIYIPNPQKDFVDKNPQHFVAENFPARGESNFYALYPNDAVAPLNNVTFRRALYYAINRKEVGSLATESGVASPTSLLVPATEYLPKATVNKWSYRYSPKTALKLLGTLGYHLKGSTLMAPNGKPETLSITVPSAFTNWIAIADVVKANLAKIGISVRLNLLSPADVFNDQALGKYQLTINGGTGGASSWFQFYYDYSSDTSAPLGKSAPFNFERFNNSAMNQAIYSYAATTNRAQQHADIAKAALISAKDLPIFPLTVMPNIMEFTTLHYTRWATAKNPYAMPSADFWPDDLYTLQHLKPVH